jgi:hypothetical protein
MVILRRAALLIVLTAGLASPAGGQENRRLRADALRALGCLTRPDAPIRLDPQFATPDGFKVQYGYKTERFPIGNRKFRSEPVLSLLVYGKTGLSAYVYRIFTAPPEAPGRMDLGNVFYLEKQKNVWQIIELWQGGQVEYTEERKNLGTMLQTPVRTIVRSDLPAAPRPCWIPGLQGGFGMRLGSAGTAFPGVRIKEQSGPFNNSFGGGAPTTVWITFWQD